MSKNKKRTKKSQNKINKQTQHQIDVKKDKKQFNIRLSANLALLATNYAQSIGISLNSLISIALVDYLQTRNFQNFHL